jgi:hypothetical protein
LRASPDVFIQAFGEPKTQLTTIPLGFWLQDRWQVRTGLTLEAGLRYDRQQMPTGIPVSSRNLSPRLGMAWHPNGNAAFVVRAGYGLFFDRYPLAFLNDAIQKNGRQGFEQYLTGSSASAALVLSRGDTLPRPVPEVLQSIYQADFDFPTTYSQKLTGGWSAAWDQTRPYRWRPVGSVASISHVYAIFPAHFPPFTNWSRPLAPIIAALQ